MALSAKEMNEMLDLHMRTLSELIDKAKINLAREIEKRGNGPETQDEGFYRGAIVGYEFAYELMLKQKLDQEKETDGH